MRSIVPLMFVAALGFAMPAAAQTAEPSNMRRSELESEVTRLRGVVQGGAVVPRRPAGCASPESRQFDFWLGEWDVSPGQSAVIIAESTITAHDQGCVILENWRPFSNAHGHSINVYDASDSKWHQTWADASGTRTEYSGGMDGDSVMRLDNLSPPPQGAPPTRRRMNFQRIDGDTVRQWGEAFNEAQQSWSTSWSFTYRRRGTAQ